MAHSESTVGRLSIHRKKHLQFLKKDEAEKWSVPYSTYREKWLHGNMKGYTGKWENGFCGENITIWAYGHHTCFRKIRLYDRKNNKTSIRRKARVGPDCRFGGEISGYLSTALKGRGIWVNSKVREHSIPQDDAWTYRMPDSAVNEQQWGLTRIRHTLMGWWE